MKKEFLVNIFLLVLVNILVKPIYLFGIDRKVQILVGTEDFGQYIALFNFTLILQFINDFGLQAWTNRTIGQQTEKVRESYGEIIGIRLQLSVCYLIFTILLGVLWFGPSMDYELFIRLCVNQILISGILFLRAQISGLGFYKTDSFISVLDRLFLILICGALIYSNSFRDNVSIVWFVNMQSISLVLVLMICIGFLIWNKFHFKPAFVNFKKTFSYLKMGFPFAMIYLMYAALTRMDNIWLVKLLEDGSYRSGQYAAGMRLYEAASMISLAFGTLLLSMFARGSSDVKKNEELLKTSISVLLVISMAIALGVAVLSKHLNQILYPPSNEEWDLVLKLLMWAFVPASINFIFGAYFQATHRENELWKLYGFAFVISAGLSLVLVPRYHVYASASIFLFVQTALMFVQFYKVEITAEKNRSFFYSILVFILICVFGFFGFSQIGLNITLQLLSIILTMLLALYFSKLFLSSDLRKFVRWVITIFLLVTSLNLDAQLSNIKWVNSAQGEHNDWAFKVKTDQQGNVYFVGHFYSDTLRVNGTLLYNQIKNLNPPSLTIFLIKYSPEGELIWAKNFHSDGALLYPDMDISKSNNIILTYSTSLSTIIRCDTHLIHIPKDYFQGSVVNYLDPNGNLLWYKILIDSIASYGFERVRFDKNEDILVGGVSVSGTMTDEKGNVLIRDSVRAYKCFLLKYNKEGRIIWTKAFGSGNDINISAITSDDSNNIILYGYFGGMQLKIDELSVLNRSKSNLGVIKADYFIAKLDSSGMAPI